MRNSENSLPPFSPAVKKKDKLLTPDELKMSFFFWYIGAISEDELIDHIRDNSGLKTSEELKTKITKMLQEIKKGVGKS